MREIYQLQIDDNWRCKLDDLTPLLQFLQLPFIYIDYGSRWCLTCMQNINLSFLLERDGQSVDKYVYMTRLMDKQVDESGTGGLSRGKCEINALEIWRILNFWIEFLQN